MARSVCAAVGTRRASLAVLASNTTAIAARRTSDSPAPSKESRGGRTCRSPSLRPVSKVAVPSETTKRPTARAIFGGISKMGHYSPPAASNRSNPASKSAIRSPASHAVAPRARVGRGGRWRQGGHPSSAAIWSGFSQILTPVNPV